MNAEETKFFTLPVGKGENRRLQIEGRKTANWSARQNGLDMALKIRGLYVREQENKGPEFSVVMIDASHRPDRSAMRRAQPKIEVPGFERTCKRRRMKIAGTRSLICRASFTSAFKLFVARG